MITIHQSATKLQGEMIIVALTSKLRPYSNGQEPLQLVHAEIDEPHIPALAPSTIREYQAHAPQLDISVLRHKDLTNGAHLEHGSHWIAQMAQMAQMIHNKKNIVI